MEEIAGTPTQYFRKSGMWVFFHFAPHFGQTAGIFSTIFMESGSSSPLTMTDRQVHTTGGGRIWDIHRDRMGTDQGQMGNGVE